MYTSLYKYFIARIFAVKKETNDKKNILILMPALLITVACITRKITFLKANVSLLPLTGQLFNVQRYGNLQSFTNMCKGIVGVGFMT